jgi:hypothetical protein
MILDGGDGGTPVYRGKWQETIRLKRVDIVWLWEVFGQMITVGS